MRYQADLVRRGAASQDAARYGEVQTIILPWLLPLGGMVVVAFVADLLHWPYRVTVLAVLVLGLPAVIGMFYATGAYLIAAIRADLQKRRTSSPDAPPS
jgi:hypothetical protein